MIMVTFSVGLLAVLALLLDQYKCAEFLSFVFVVCLVVTLISCAGHSIG